MTILLETTDIIQVKEQLYMAGLLGYMIKFEEDKQDGDFFIMGVNEPYGTHLERRRGLVTTITQNKDSNKWGYYINVYGSPRESFDERQASLFVKAMTKCLKKT